MQYLPPPSEGEPSPPRVESRKRGAGGTIGAAGAAILAFLLKFKVLLLVGLKLLAPMWTFLLSLWIYVALFGWKLAVVLMFVLLAHELGHYFAFRAYGLPVRLPSFVPLFGAFTAGAPPEDLEHDAYIALAGPLTGLGLAAACYFVAGQTNDRFWYACADVSAFLNLFNMIPMPPFDGGRIVGALWPPLWFVGFALFVVFSVFFHIPLLFVVIIGVLGLPSILATIRGRVDPRAANMTLAARLRVSVWYLATLVGLLWVMAQSHAIANPGTAGAALW
ncbi:MAG TPA: site-2 protease family protein [Candidatus Acidoferrales bacterium]|nr:site-2 protease family protein [Candidatus Acidoferrales bacterium]